MHAVGGLPLLRAVPREVLQRDSRHCGRRQPISSSLELCRWKGGGKVDFLFFCRRDAHGATETHLGKGEDVSNGYGKVNRTVRDWTDREITPVDRRRVAPIYTLLRLHPLHE